MQKQLRFFNNLIPTIERFGIIVTIVLLPLDRLPYLHRIPFGLGVISFIALFVAAAWRLVQQYRNQGLQSLRLHVLVAGMLVLPPLGYAISSLSAINSKAAYAATLTLTLVCARAFFFFVLLKSNKDLWLLVRKTIYIVTGIVVAFGLFQYFFDTWGASTAITDLKSCCTSNSTYVFPRVHSTALEPLYFDHFLMIPLWLLTFDFLRTKKDRKNKKLVVLFILTATLFILTIARSATIGILVAAIIFTIGLRHHKEFKNTIKLQTKLWGIAILTAISLVLMSGVASTLIDKSAQYNTKGLGSVTKFGSHAVDFDDGSSKTRYEVWPRSITYFKEQPVDGVGPDNSRVRLNLEAYEKGAPHKTLQPFNNDFLGLVVDVGLVGLMAFLPITGAVIFVIYKQLKSGWKHIYAPFALVLIGMAVQGNFFQSILLTRTWFVVGILLITLEASEGKKKKKRKT